jgi:hypothetical protein
LSHQPHRKEKDCLNCGTIVHGPFCHICGQENVVTKQNFLSLTQHFIYDVFHFDGKFFETLKFLVTRPGYIPKQFIEGKRKSYLDPIRMYLFTSAVFFLVFFSVKDPREAIIDSGSDSDFNLSPTERLMLAGQLNRANDSGKLNAVLDTFYRIKLFPVKLGEPPNNDSIVEWQGKSYRMKAEPFTDIIKTSSRGWFKRAFDKKWNEYRKIYGDDTKAMLAEFGSSFLHKLPYVLFVSLPLFALILKLLYVRRKKMLFSEHSIFTLYHYIFSFILLLLYFLLDAMTRWTGWSIFTTISVFVLLSGGIYLFIAMKRFYGQSFGKTLIKFLILNSLGFLVLILIMAGFLLFSIIQI